MERLIAWLIDRSYILLMSHFQFLVQADGFSQSSPLQLLGFWGLSSDNASARMQREGSAIIYFHQAQGIPPSQCLSAVTAESIRLLEPGAVFSENHTCHVELNEKTYPCLLIEINESEWRSLEISYFAVSCSMIYYFTDAIYRLIDWLIACLFHRLTDWLIDWLVIRLLDWLVVRSIDCWIDWLVDWTEFALIFFHCSIFIKKVPLFRNDVGRYESESQSKWNQNREESPTLG